MMITAVLSSLPSFNCRRGRWVVALMHRPIFFLMISMPVTLI